ncbi:MULTISPECIES: zf-TFIIB domain-containing protein [Polyangium]|uniref:Uncharacterized protein n=2 Tax=Polyangium TaxID=55 RepID=A0A4V5PKJ5_9BACT|nr:MULTISPECIES: zf-TFIIB domain-containing protein [Polyangium]MDI1437037.1 zf-TFIIB domain-containing protein [Polyangium sorediatum]TKC95752.1 hypothetical protein E8A74_46715 [Polyangium fumosum]
MSEQYRLASPQCPLCAGLLQERPTPGAVVDVCADCHAVWIDWFDGDVSSVASAVEVRPAVPQARPGARTCPRCRDTLAPEHLRGHGPEILRCPGCAGVLIPSTMLAEVVALGPIEDTSPPTPEEGLFRRMLNAIRALGA